MLTTTKGYHYPAGTDRVMDGDDTIAALANDLDAKAGLMAMGNVTPPTVAAGAVGSVAVTFPVGRFTVAPIVQATSQAGASFINSARMPSATNITTTGFTIYEYRDNGSGAFNLFWWAVQL